MNVVRPALRDGVHHASRRASVLGRIVRRRHLELANRIGAERVREPGAPALFSEERLCVVAAIDAVAVEQAGDSAEAHQPEVSVRRGAGRHQRERRPAARVRRQVGDGGLVDVRREVRLLGVDDRRLADYVHRFCLARDSKGNIEVGNPPDFDDDVCSLLGGEPRERHLDGVNTRLQSDHGEPAGTVGRPLRDGVRREITRGDRDAGQASARLIGNEPADSAVGS